MATSNTLGVVTIISIEGVAASTSKRQEKLTLLEIMAAEPATPKYLTWSKYPMQFSREDQWNSFFGLYPPCSLSSPFRPPMHMLSKEQASQTLLLVYLHDRQVIKFLRSALARQLALSRLCLVFEFRVLGVKVQIKVTTIYYFDYFLMEV